jgi:hypothetical protein
MESQSNKSAVFMLSHQAVQGRGSPPVVSAVVVPVPYSSPNSNRDRFLQGYMLKLKCLLTDIVDDERFGPVGGGFCAVKLTIMIATSRTSLSLTWTGPARSTKPSTRTNSSMQDTSCGRSGGRGVAVAMQTQLPLLIYSCR